MREIARIYIVLFFILASFQLYGQEVILIRHAKVFLEKEGWMGPKKATKQREMYDTAPIHQFLPDMVLAKLSARVTDTIYVSGLARSIATGWKLYGDSVNLVSMELLNEFELSVFPLPLVLPFKGWTSISRGMWLMGVKRPNTESFKAGKKRAKLAVDFIEEKAKYNSQVILVTHGFLNRTIAKEMKKRGWERTQNEGRKNLGATILKN